MFLSGDDTMPFEFVINGRPTRVDVPANMPLLWVIRDVLNLRGTKYGCGVALCGACTVHVDGEATRSCITPVSEVAGKKVTTIEVEPLPAKQRLHERQVSVECQHLRPGLQGSLFGPRPRVEDFRIQGPYHPCRKFHRTRIVEVGTEQRNEFLANLRPLSAPRFHHYLL